MQVNKVTLEYLGHSGFLISNGGGKIIAIDPYNISLNVPKADLVLITHSHYDHCSIKDIQKVAKEGSVIVIPADVQSKIARVKGVDMEIIEVGDELQFGRVKVLAVPAYNTKKDYHPKSEGWLGYVIKINETVIYHAGDTDKIPEMSRLTGYGKRDNEFIALLPVSGEFVMDAEEAADVASLLSPDLVIPIHYGAGVAGTREDAERFVSLCKDLNIKSKILEKI